MSVTIRTDRIKSTSIAVDSPIATPKLRFASREPEPGAWRRFLVLAKRAYGPLIVYAILGVALVAAVAIRVSIWVPMYWR
jgi:hypothetical protein